MDSRNRNLKLRYTCSLNDIDFLKIQDVMTECSRNCYSFQPYRSKQERKYDSLDNEAQSKVAENNLSCYRPVLFDYRTTTNNHLVRINGIYYNRKSIPVNEKKYNDKLKNIENLPPNLCLHKPNIIN